MAANGPQGGMGKRATLRDLHTWGRGVVDLFLWLTFEAAMNRHPKVVRSGKLHAVTCDCIDILEDDKPNSVRKESRPKQCMSLKVLYLPERYRFSSDEGRGVPQLLCRERCTNKLNRELPHQKMLPFVRN
jgi:hypothetical protein